MKALSTLCETSTGLLDGNYAAILAAVWLVHNPIVTLAACETREVRSTPDNNWEITMHLNLSEPSSSTRGSPVSAQCVWVGEPRGTGFNR